MAPKAQADARPSTASSSSASSSGSSGSTSSSASSTSSSASASGTTTNTATASSSSVSQVQQPLPPRPPPAQVVRRPTPSSTISSGTNISTSSEESDGRSNRLALQWVIFVGKLWKKHVMSAVADPRKAGGDPQKQRPSDGSSSTGSSGAATIGSSSYLRSDGASSPDLPLDLRQLEKQAAQEEEELEMLKHDLLMLEYETKIFRHGLGIVDSVLDIGPSQDGTPLQARVEKAMAWSPALRDRFQPPHRHRRRRDAPRGAGRSDDLKARPVLRQKCGQGSTPFKDNALEMPNRGAAW